MHHILLQRVVSNLLRQETLQLVQHLIRIESADLITVGWGLVLNNDSKFAQACMYIFLNYPLNMCSPTSAVNV